MRSRIDRHASVWAAAVYGLGGLLLTWPLPLHLLDAIPGDGFDGWQNLWNLWWVRRALFAPSGGLWHTDMLDYPRGVSLLFHTLNLPNGLLSLPVQEMAGLIPAYNLVVFLSFSLSGLGAYLLALRVLGERSGRARASALVAGAIFAYSPFHFAHLLGHMQVFSLQWLPLYALALHGVLDERCAGRAGWRPAVLALVFLLLASLTDWYNLVYLAILTLLWALWFAAGLKTRRQQALVLAAPAALLLLAVILLSPLLVPMALQAAESDFMVTGDAHLVSLSADLIGFVLPQEMHPLWGDAVGTLAQGFTASTSERMLSLGIAPLLLAVVGWWTGGRRSRPFTWAGLAFAVLALGPVLHVNGEAAEIAGRPIALPGLALYRWVPFLAIARSVGRYAVMVSLSVSVLAAIGLQRLSAKLGRRWALGPWAALALVLVEFLPAPYPLSPPDTPPWYSTLADAGPAAILNLPVNWDRPQYLLYQTAHEQPLTSGYTSRRNPWSPVESYPGLQQLRRLGDDVLAFPDPDTFATIAKDIGLRYVVVDSYQMPGGYERKATLALSERLLQAPEPVYRDERLTVYGIDQPPADRAYAVLQGIWGAVQEGRDGAPERGRGPDGQVIGRAGALPADFTVSCRGIAAFVVGVAAGAEVSLLAEHPDCNVLVSVCWLER